MGGVGVAPHHCSWITQSGVFMTNHVHCAVLHPMVRRQWQWSPWQRLRDNGLATLTSATRSMDSGGVAAGTRERPAQTPSHVHTGGRGGTAEREGGRCAGGTGRGREGLWGSELPPLFLQQVQELLQWEPAVCGVMRAVCSTWCGILDALLPRLQPRRSLAVMKGKLGWYQSVTEVDLLSCGADGPAEHAVAPQPLAAIDLCGVHGGSTLRRCVVSRRSPRCAYLPCG